MKRDKKIIKIFLFFIGIFILLEFFLYFKKFEKKIDETTYSKNNESVGFIGGIKFSFPKNKVRFLEFDEYKNPGPFLEEEKNRLNVGNNIRSFSMLISREEISFLSDQYCMLDEINNVAAPIYIGVGAGTLYAGDEFASTMTDSASHRLNHVYELKKVERFGLEHYVPLDIDPIARKKNPHPNFNDVDIYLNRNHQGIADLYIECRNTNYETAPCRMMFSMSPKLRITLNVSFQRFDLPYANCIKKYSSDLIMKFKSK